jgi:ABC-2 type transport system ATP-binding protein
MDATADLDRHSGALTIDRLTKVYADGTRALDELSLRIPAGSSIGLLGPNGAGKTTLIGAVAGLVRAPPGRIFVFGHDPRRADRRGRSRASSLIARGWRLKP